MISLCETLLVVESKRQQHVPRHAAKQRIARMYQTAFARPPSESETAAVLAFLAGRDNNDQGIWADLAHVLINSKEFIYIN